jgi:hypothetical protein
MEAMLGISLYRYLYLQLAKTLCLSYLLFFFFNKIGEQEDRQYREWEGGEEEKGGGEGGHVGRHGPNNVYIYK